MPKSPSKSSPGKNKLSNLSERLVYALDKLNVTQAELARLVGIKPQAINYLCSSQSKKSGFTYEIADALKINNLWLACGTGEMQLTEDLEMKFILSQQRVPVLDCKQIKRILNKDEALENVITPCTEWMLTTSNIGNKGFAFRLLDKSMYPRFEQDSIIIINRDKVPQDKDFVLVYLKESDSIVFRQYEINKKSNLLKPANTVMYKTIEKNIIDPILGVMVEARWQT